MIERLRNKHILALFFFIAIVSISFLYMSSAFIAIGDTVHPHKGVTQNPLTTYSDSDMIKVEAEKGPLEYEISKATALIDVNQTIREARFYSSEERTFQGNASHDGVLNKTLSVNFRKLDSKTELGKDNHKISSHVVLLDENKNIYEKANITAHSNSYITSSATLFYMGAAFIISVIISSIFTIYFLINLKNTKILANRGFLSDKTKKTNLLILILSIFAILVILPIITIPFLEQINQLLGLYLIAFLTSFLGFVAISVIIDKTTKYINIKYKNKPPNYKILTVYPEYFIIGVITAPTLALIAFEGLIMSFVYPIAIIVIHVIGRGPLIKSLENMKKNSKNLAIIDKPTLSDVTIGHKASHGYLDYQHVETAICTNCQTTLNEENLYKDGQHPQIGFEYYQCSKCNHLMPKEEAIR